MFQRKEFKQIWLEKMADHREEMSRQVDSSVRPSGKLYLHNIKQNINASLELTSKLCVWLCKKNYCCGVVLRFFIAFKQILLGYQV